MAENKVCPHCGGQMFMATITRACVVEALTDSNNPYKILKESKDKFDIEILKCARCKKDVTEADLVAGIKCKECGRLVSPVDVDENGVCNVCTAIHQRSELANASKEDLIKMLLDAEKKANPIAAKMEKQIEKADNAMTVSNNDKDTEEQSAEENQADSTTTSKKTRRKARKKKSDEEIVQETTPDTDSNETKEVEEVKQEEPVEETAEVNDLANQQEAPFPEMNPPEDIVPEQVSEPTQEERSEEQPIGADFQMFEDDEEPF